MLNKIANVTFYNKYFVILQWKKKKTHTSTSWRKLVTQVNKFQLEVWKQKLTTNLWTKLNDMKNEGKNHQEYEMYISEQIIHTAVKLLWPRLQT